MTRQISPALLMSCMAGAGLAAFVAGFAIAGTVPVDHTRDEPIINPRAWEEQAPQPVAYTPTPIENCNPWEISDVAAEEMLREMIRRGWRPPNQGDVIASLDPLDTSALSAVNPDEPLPLPGVWRARADEEDVAEGAPVVEPPSVIEVTAEGAIPISQTGMN